jgi:hypothetical protein
VETKFVKKDIVRDYTQYESAAYGPLTRNGYFPDKLTDKYLVKSRFLDTYTGLLELESTLPSNALKIRLPIPKRISSTKDGYLKRKFRRERDLDNIMKVRPSFDRSQGSMGTRLLSSSGHRWSKGEDSRRTETITILDQSREAHSTATHTRCRCPKLGLSSTHCFFIERCASLLCHD